MRCIATASPYGTGGTGGTGKFLAWLVDKDITPPHVPVRDLSQR